MFENVSCPLCGSKDLKQSESRPTPVMFPMVAMGAVSTRPDMDVPMADFHCNTCGRNFTAQDKPEVKVYPDPSIPPPNTGRTVFIM